jgi:radical SAM superfamily enzyme YgiQ (UPF0313 family)
MKLLLTQPAWSQIYKNYATLARGNGSSPPLGIGYLAALARSAGVEVAMLDAEAEAIPTEDLGRRVLAWKPDVVGISAHTPTYHQAVHIAEYIKEHSPKTVIIVGGPHISILGTEAFFPCFDLAVRGEAELIFVDLLQEIERPAPDFGGIPGVIFRQNGVAVDGGFCPPPQDLNELPFPAWDLYCMDRYWTRFKKRGRTNYVTMSLTRGCPFKCVFCTTPALEGKRLRKRSAENLVAELRLLKTEYGVDHVCFNDSSLTLDRRLIEDFCHQLISSGLGTTWDGWTRANLVDQELLNQMAAAGLIRITFGIESGSPRILKLLKKEVSHEDIRRAYRMASKAGLECTCSAMMGNPGETLWDIFQTVRFIRSIGEIDYSPLSIAVPYPGSDLFQMAKAKEAGLELITEDFSQYLRYSGGVMKVNGMDPAMLRRVQLLGLIFMHLTPRKIIGASRRYGLTELLQSILKF